MSLVPVFLECKLLKGFGDLTRTTVSFFCKSGQLQIMKPPETTVMQAGEGMNLSWSLT